MMGKALNNRIRYYFQTKPSYLEWSGVRDLDEDPKNIRCLPKGFQFIPPLFQEFSLRLGETLEHLKPVGRRLEPLEEEMLARFSILLAAFQQWDPYRHDNKPMLKLAKRKQTFSGLWSLVKPHWVDDLCQLSRLFYERSTHGDLFPLPPLFSRPAIFEASFEGVGWASADLIVDNRLIEIKATKDPCLKQSYI